MAGLKLGGCGWTDAREGVAGLKLGGCGWTDAREGVAGLMLGRVWLH